MAEITLLKLSQEIHKKTERLQNTKMTRDEILNELKEIKELAQELLERADLKKFDIHARNVFKKWGIF